MIVRKGLLFGGPLLQLGNRWNGVGFMKNNCDFSALKFIGDRITIRLLQAEDYEAFVQGFQDCLPSQNRFDEGWMDTGFMTRVWYAEMLERRAREAETDFSYMLHLFRNCDGKSLGYCDITPHRRENFQYARIGYTILNPYWKMGYGTQCVGGLVKLGFESLRLHRLEAHVNLDNYASKRVLQKAGFSFECVRKGFILEDGVWTDNAVYFLNHSGWQENP